MNVYIEVNNQFSASGFNLPPGSMAYRVLEVSNEISRKNRSALNREIIISQAELAEEYTVYNKPGKIEASLMDFHNQQQARLKPLKQQLLLELMFLML